MIAAPKWLRIWVISVKVPGLNSSTGKFFFNIFHAPFYPVVTVLLEYFDPVIYSCLVFAL